MGGKLSRVVYLAPHLGIESYYFFAHSTCFKLSVHEVVSFIIISQVKNKVFFFVIWSYTLSCRGGGQAVQGDLSCPPPGYYV